MDTDSHVRHTLGFSWIRRVLTIAGTPKRGVVVKVYTCPGEWGGSSTTQDLGDYESGVLGKYYN
jgi:hypothetical protein